MTKEKCIVVVIAAYFILRQTLNLIVGGFLLSQLVLLVMYIVLAILLMNGTKYTNYITAFIVALIAFYYLPTNLRLLPGSWLYLLEGLLDLGAAALLTFPKSIVGCFAKKSGDA